MAERAGESSWARAEEQAGTFATAPVPRPGSPWGRAGGLVIAALAAFAGVGAFGQLLEPQPPATATLPRRAELSAPAVATAAPAIPTVMIEGPWPPSRGMGDAFVPVRLEQPMARAGGLTDEAIDVLGELRIHAASVRVALQTLDLLTLDSTVVDTSNVDGGIRPLHAPGIDVRLALPTPRPTGERLWIVVTAYDTAGRALGAVRRIVTIGELAGADEPVD